MAGDMDWKGDVSKKLDRILNDLDFIKNRTSVYLGRNEVLTYLPDETPIFVNSDDFGCPLNFINGGLYEEDYFSVFLSFRDPEQPMLDIGANLGVYSLRMAAYMRSASIHAFEPIPRIRNLFSRSSFLNGFGERIQIHPFAVSDKAGKANLQVPTEHAGGASLEAMSDETSGISVDVKMLDDFFSEDFSCGLVKLDVEGHELHALKGMRSILGRSKRCAVMFEKLAPNSGIEGDVYDFFTDLDWMVYGIQGRTLEALELDAFAAKGGYFVAAPAEYVMRDGLNRNFFKVFPSDLNVLEGNVEGGKLKADISNKAGCVVFHGPYWYMPRGYYRLTFDGEINAPVTLDICEKFGFKVSELRIEPGKLSVDFPIYRDLSKFEVVMRPVDDARLSVSMNLITVTRLG